MRVRRLVDLSVSLQEGMQVYPGDPVFRTSPAATITEDGFNLRQVQMGSQTGTHVDAPYHFDELGARVDELDLALFVGPAVLVDATGLRPREPIDWPDFAPYADQLRERTIVLLHTGWAAHWGTPAYHDHPYLDASAVERLLDLGVRTLLLDALNPDETPDADHLDRVFRSTTWSPPPAG